MEKVEKYIWLVIGIIILIVGVSIKDKYFPTIETTIVYDTVWTDTVKIKKYIKEPYPVYVDTGSVQIIILPVDSAEITEAYIKLHKKYFSTYYYKDTLKNDSIAFIEIGAKITQNKPVSYDLNYFNKTPSIINNTTNIYSQNEFWIGLDVGKGIICPNILYKLKKGYNFGVGYNLENNSIVLKAGVNINKIIVW